MIPATRSWRTHFFLSAGWGGDADVGIAEGPEDRRAWPTAGEAIREPIGVTGVVELAFANHVRF